VNNTCSQKFKDAPVIWVPSQRINERKFGRKKTKFWPRAIPRHCGAVRHELHAACTDALSTMKYSGICTSGAVVK
jgi:hypothetical protein